MAITPINAATSAPAIDAKHKKPKHEPAKATPCTDILKRLPTAVTNAAYSFLEVQELTALPCCSTSLRDQVNDQMPRIWQAACRSFPNAIEWPDFSKMTAKAIKTAVIENLFERIESANRALSAYSVTNHPLKRDIAKFSEKKAKELVCKIQNPWLRFNNHTLPTVKAIARNSPPYNQHFRCLMDTLGRKSTDDPQGFLNLFFICGEELNGSTLNTFITGFCRVARDQYAGDLFPEWVSALKFFAKEGPLPDSESLESLVRLYWDNCLEKKGFNFGIITDMLTKFLERGVKIEERFLNFYVGSTHSAPLRLLEPLCKQAAKDGVHPTNLFHFLNLIFVGHFRERYRHEKGDDIAKAIEYFRPPETPIWGWNQLYGDQPFQYFYGASKFRRADLMKQIIQVGGKPDNSSTDSNTLSVAIRDKSPLDEISLLWCFGARPCENTFGLVEQYSPDLETRQALHKLLTEHR